MKNKRFGKTYSSQYTHICTHMPPLVLLEITFNQLHKFTFIGLQKLTRLEPVKKEKIVTPYAWSNSRPPVCDLRVNNKFSTIL